MGDIFFSSFELILSVESSMNCEENNSKTHISVIWGCQAAKCNTVGPFLKEN